VRALHAARGLEPGSSKQVMPVCFREKIPFQQMPEGEKEMQSHEALKLRSHDPLILADLVIAAEKAIQATY